MAEAAAGEWTPETAARAPHEELLRVTAELTWLLLGTLRPTQPLGVIFDTIIARIEESDSTHSPVSNAAAGGAARPQPPAGLATGAAASVPPTGIDEAVRKALHGRQTRVKADLATAVANKAQLDRAVLAATTPAAAALLQLARGQADADIRHAAIVSSLLSRAEAAAGSVPAAVVGPSLISQAMVSAPLPIGEVVADQPPEVASGQVLPASATPCNAAEHPCSSPAIGSQAAW
jgi:hypothetical protein